MVFPDSEHVESELVGELDLLHELGHALARADARGEIREGGDSELHTHSVRRYLCARKYLLCRRKKPRGVVPGPPSQLAAKRREKRCKNAYSASVTRVCEQPQQAHSAPDQAFRACPWGCRPSADAMGGLTPP